MAESSKSGGLVKLELKRLTLAELVTRDALLETSPLVKAIPQALRAEFLSNGLPRRLGAQGPIFRKGDMVGPLYLVLKGEVQLLNAEGVELARASKGEFFGESEVVSPAPARRGTAVAATELDYAEFDATYVTSLLKRVPSLRAVLGEVDAARTQAHTELDDFLNRW
jgi:CRP-like cAMP-binding protein